MVRRAHAFAACDRGPDRAARFGTWLLAFALASALSACEPTEGDDVGFSPVKTTNADFSVALVETGKRPIFMAAADIDSDGTIDVATADRFDNTVTVHTEGFASARTLDVGEQPTDVLIGDLDGGDLDLVVLSELGSRISVFLDDGAGGWNAQHIELENEFATQISLEDLNNDGQLDIVVSVTSAGRILALVNDGTGDFSDQVNSGTLDGPQRFVIGDWNGDTLPDLAVLHPREDRISVLTGNGSGVFSITPSDGYNVKDNPIHIVSADFNGDGDPDLAVSNRFTDKISVFLGTGGAGFSLLDHVDVKASPGALVAGAFTGDGVVNDVVVLHRTKRAVSVLTWDGAAGEFDEDSFKVSRDPFDLAVGDFNVDGLPDLVTTETDERVFSVLAGDGAGGFERTVIGFTSRPSFPLVVDLDGNGTDDVLLLHTNSDRFVVLENVH